jgi:Ligand-gated ion channel
MVTRQQRIEEPFDPKSFMVPFEYSVWLAILAAIFVTGMAYFFLERLNNGLDDHQGLEDKPLLAIFIAALTFTGHFQFRPNSIASRMLSISWGFWAVIVTSAYTANLASFLVSQSKTVTRISTLEDAIVTSTPLCVQRGAVVDTILSDKYPELKLVRKDTEEAMFQGLSLDWYGGGGGCGALLTNLGTFDIYSSRSSANSDCSLSSDKRVVLNLPAGFATAVDSAIQCTSLINYVLDLHLQEMHQDGFIGAVWDQHVASLADIQCHDPISGLGLSSTTNTESKGGGSNSLSMKEMGGIFLLHSILCLVALCFALYQYFHVKNTKPEQKLRPINLEENVRKVNETIKEIPKQMNNAVIGSVQRVNDGMRELPTRLSDAMEESARRLNDSMSTIPTQAKRLRWNASLGDSSKKESRMGFNVSDPVLESLDSSDCSSFDDVASF